MDVALVFLPLAGAIIAGLFGRIIGDRGAQWVTCSFMLVSALLAVVVFVLCFTPTPIEIHDLVRGSEPSGVTALLSRAH